MMARRGGVVGWLGFGGAVALMLNAAGCSKSASDAAAADRPLLYIQYRSAAANPPGEPLGDLVAAIWEDGRIMVAQQVDCAPGESYKVGRLDSAELSSIVTQADRVFDEAIVAQAPDASGHRIRLLSSRGRLSRDEDCIKDGRSPVQRLVAVLQKVKMSDATTRSGRERVPDAW